MTSCIYNFFSESFENQFSIKLVGTGSLPYTFSTKVNFKAEVVTKI